MNVLLDRRDVSSGDSIADVPGSRCLVGAPQRIRQLLSAMLVGLSPASLC